MTLPGLGFFLMVGTALAGVMYFLYQQRTQEYQHGGNHPHFTPPLQSLEPSYDTLPRRRKSESRKKECSICLDTLAKDLQELPCTHTFHRHCITMWLRDNDTCPICRDHC